MGALFDAAGTEGAFDMCQLEGFISVQGNKGLVLVLLVGQLSKAEFSLWVL